MNLTIEKASIENVDAIKNILSTTWKHTYSDFFNQETISKITHEWHNVEVLSRQIQNEKVIFKVGSIQNQLIGIGTAFEVEENLIQLGRLYILPEFQRKGFGERIFKALLVDVRERKCKSFLLHVEEKNQKAFNFYKKIGFHPIRTLQEDVFGFRINLIEMELKIGDN